MRTADASPSAPPSPDEIRAELERLAASKNFRKAERCLRLLRHVTELAVEGRGAELKEYSVGIAVFDRPAAFDPRTDPVVRLEARRLRLKLAEYYLSEGREDAVILDLPKGGYVPEFRFRAASPPDSPAPAAQPLDIPPVAPPRRPRLAPVAIAMLAVVLMVLLGYLLLSGRTGHEGLHSVAVLPFRDNSPDKDLGYLSNGIRDGLTSLLVRNRRIEVTARASSAQVAEQSNPGRVAAELQTDTLVSGSVSPSGNGAQVVITLVQGRTGKYLWSRTYLVKPGDLAIVEQSAATEIAQALGVAAAAVAPVVPSTPEAVESYLKACALARLRTPDGSREAARLFEQVLRAEPDFARGYAAAASNYLVAGQNGAIPWADSGIRGVDLARKSLALDPALSEAHASMALGLQTQWKWQESMDELAKASALDPRSPVPHFRMAYTLTILRRFPEAEREINIARQLDPAWIAAHGLLAEIYLYERQYDAALDFARRFRTTTRDPFFDDLIARVSISQGNWDVARPLLSKSQSPFLRALSRAAGGDVHGAYENLLSDVKSGNATAYHLASFCVLQIHDRALTLNWLKQSFHDHDPDLVTVMLDPMWDGLRNDSQVTDMMKAMNLL